MPRASNSRSAKLAMIPAGEFKMGNGESFETLKKAFREMPRNHYKTAEPQHLVRITKAFHLGAHEVTVRQLPSLSSKCGSP